MDTPAQKRLQVVRAEKAPEPAGHYSQAISHNGLVYVSGQLGVQPESTANQASSIEEQTRIALANVSEILKAAHSDLSLVIKATVYVSDIGLWDRVNKVYSEVFGDHRPARAIVPCKELHFGLQVEIDVVAATAES